MLQILDFIDCQSGFYNNSVKPEINVKDKPRIYGDNNFLIYN